MAPPINTGLDPEKRNSGKPRKKIQTWDRPEYSVTIQGEVVEFKHHKEWIPPKNRKKREVISTFSRQARFRLLKFTATIDYRRSGFAVLVTVTYPDEFFGVEAKARNIHRAHFLRKLESYLGVPCKGLWRLEWEPRQTGMRVGEFLPHFHFLFYGLPFVPFEMVNQWWKGVIHWDGYCRTEIRAARTKRESGAYVSKYVAKASGVVPLSLHHITPISGRHFGYVRKQLIPRHKTKVTTDLDECTRKELLDLARGVDPVRADDCDDSFTLLWGRAKVAERIVAGMGEKSLDDPFWID